MHDSRWGRTQRGGGTARTFLTVALVLSMQCAVASAQHPADIPLEVLAEMDLEQLMAIDVSVTTVAGVPQDVFSTPSAITVITAEDIRRSGHQSLAEALRLVPGMFVGRTHSHTWRVGARGFTGGLANKNLVLIDGRSVWDPLQGGVFWDVQDVVLEDIDRIEVIRGPGATLWGANAMNGVVNVITKSARETQGVYVTGGGGTYEQGFGTIRYGGQAGENTWFRVYSKYFNRDHFVDADGRSTQDDWSMLRGGFRLDSQLDHDLNLTLQGDGYGSLTMGEVANVPVAPGIFQPLVTDRQVSGGNVLARLSRETGTRDGWSLQTYYDRTNRRQAAGFEVRRDTFDIDFRHHFGWGDDVREHNFIWGLRYNFTTDRTEPGPQVIYDPRSRSLSTFSGFLQNTFVLQPDRWFAMLGTKLEHNDFTGFEIQPGARLWYTPGEQHMFWGSISRPVRVPTRTEEDVFLIFALLDPAEPGQPPVPVGVMGGDDLDAERMVAYELGHRFRPNRNFMIETSLFFNDYSRLIFVSEPIIGERFNNRGRGSAYGGEVEVSWRVADNWRLAGGYGFTNVEVRGPILQTEEGTHPQHIAHGRSYLDITDDLEFNTAIYYVDNVPDPNVPKYFRLDVGMTWRPTHNFEIAVWGQNLLHPSHREASFREFERGFYVQGTIRF